MNETVRTSPHRANRFFLILLIAEIAGGEVLARTGIVYRFPIPLAMMTGELLMILPAVLIFLVRRENPFSYIPFKVLKPSVLLLLIAFMFTIMPQVVLANLLSMLVTENVVANAAEQFYSVGLPLSVLLIGVLPGVCEEFIFRGVIHQQLRRERIWPAILLSALFFGLMHQNLNQFGYACIMGIWFALLTEATGSLLSSMFVHALYNTQSVVMMWLSKDAISGQGAAAGMDFMETIRQIVAESGYTGQTAETAAVIAAVCVAVFLAAAAVVSILLSRLVLRAIARRCGRQDHLQVLFSRQRRRELDALRDPSPRSVWTWEAAAAVVIGAAYIVYRLF